VCLLSGRRDAVLRRDAPRESDVKRRAYRMSKANSTEKWTVEVMQLKLRFGDAR